jgi:hypothetical protein
MSRPISPNYDQATLLPPCVENWVSARHPARFVRDFVGTLDLRALGFRDSPGEHGRPHLAFDMLLAVWLFGWMDRIVEHPFGIIKAIDGFGRFTVRGLAAANAQWALVCSAYNLRKMYAFWLQGEMNLGGF